MAGNQQVSQRTKHIDIWHHYLRERAKNKEVATKFCWSEENQADVMTKNVTVQCFRQYYPSIRSIDAERCREDVERWWKDTKDIGQSKRGFGQPQIELKEIPQRQNRQLAHTSQGPKAESQGGVARQGVCQDADN